MGIFSSIIDKLRGHSRHQQQASTGQAGQQQPGQSGGSYQQTQYAPPQGQQAGQAGGQQLQNVDVDAVLKDLAAKKGGGGNYRESIVDLLKLLDLDSSLDARKELAKELNVNAGAHGSAEQNIALQKAVLRELQKNGGKVPDSLRD